MTRTSHVKGRIKGEAARPAFAFLCNLSAAATAAALLLAFATAAAGQDQTPNPAEPNQLKQLSLEQLGNIQVTTQSKTPVEVWKTTAAIYVITQDDIRRAGVTTIPEALRLAPGVEVTRIDSNKWSIGIRGFGSRLNRDVLVLMDGRSLYNPLLAGTYWEVQDTVIEDIDRIEVIRGPGGTAWGPNAVNGVINIITKSTKETQGALADYATSNFKHGFGTLRYGGQNASGSLAYRVYAKGYDRGAQYHADGDNYDSWHSEQAGFRADWTRDTHNSFTFEGDIYDERAGETVTSVNYAPPYSQIVQGDMRLSGGNLIGRWTRAFTGDSNDLQIQAYYDATNRREPNFGDIRKTFDFDYIQRTPLDHRNESTHRNELSWGIGIRASHGDELQTTTGLFFTPSSLTDTLYTQFVEDDVSLVPNRLVLQGGTKLINTNYTGLEAEPSVRLLWTPTSTRTVWFAFTRALRTPSDAERAFNLSGFISPPSASTDGLATFARFEANPNFKSEKLSGYELGYRSLIKKNLFLDIASFYNQYSDLFSEDVLNGGAQIVESSPPPAHNLIQAEFGNGLQGSTYGGEIAPAWQATSWWLLRGSYSFLHMDLNRSPNSMDIGTAPITEGSSPDHQVLIQSSFDFPKRVAFDFDYRYVSKLPALAIAAYHTADARLAWTINSHIELSANADNLFQPFHYEYLSDPGPNVAIKRSYFGKIVFTTRQPQ
jgi:iron complex outermembrane receptor protein